MGLVITTTFAVSLWIVLWAIGVRSFDGFLVTLVIVLVGASLKLLTQFLPGASRSKGSDGGW